jgi:hypothetical protein
VKDPVLILAFIANQLPPYSLRHSILESAADYLADSPGRESQTVERWWKAQGWEI